MSNTKHTPGPWSIYDPRIPGERGTRTGITSKSGAIGFANRLEDAILFAASPSLLEAIKPFTECDFDSRGRAVVRVTIKEMHSLRAAIAAAEGR